MFDVDAVDADEYLVYKDLADTFDCGWTNQREPVSTQKSSGHDDLQIVAVTQFHRHVDCIRQNCDSLMKTNAAGDLRRGCSRADRENVAIANQFGRDQTDATFFGAALSFLFVIGGSMAKRFIKQWLNSYCAAVAATKESALLKLAEIPANGRRRNLQAVGQ